MTPMLELQEPKSRTSRVEELLASTLPHRDTITLPPRSLEELRNSSIPVNQDLMQRLHEFLPAMQQSTQQLEQQAQSDPSSLDIEHLDPFAQEYIEMNLGLGVYESRPDSSDSSDSSDSDSDSDESGESDSGSDSDSDRPDVLSILMSAVPPVPRLPPAPSRPNIVVLHSSPQPSNAHSSPVAPHR